MEQLKFKFAGCPDGKTEDWTSGAQEKKTTEETSHKRNGKSVRILSRENWKVALQGSNASASLPSRIWSKFYKLDPRIAFGKYSPMEKEILRLGGIHTMAARRLLALKKEEEHKMLRELQLQSPDYIQVAHCKKHTSGKVRAPLERIESQLGFSWTRQPWASPGNSLEGHIFRLLGDLFLPYVERFRGSMFPSGGGLGPQAKDKAWKKGDSYDSYYHHDNIKEQNPTKRHEIKMNVIFKSEEPKKCIACHRHARQPFLTIRKLERCITGQTNRNRLSLAEFPGDLMLMTQDFLSQGTHPPLMRINPPLWKKKESQVLPHWL
uniref:Uncharacterized protein n=1 Tax=Spermophilus dauricus TaxID=99837 RepID=A0A8C9UUH2_SPEDA